MKKIVKRYNASGLRKPFTYPVVGRILLLATLILFPIVGPASAVWVMRKEIIEEWLEIAQATFLPWTKKDKKKK